MSGPRTEAGRHLLAQLVSPGGHWEGGVDDLVYVSDSPARTPDEAAQIVAIEAEAVAQDRTMMAAKVRALPAHAIDEPDGAGWGVSREDLLRLIEAEPGETDG